MEQHPLHPERIWEWGGDDAFCGLCFQEMDFSTELLYQKPSAPEHLQHKCLGAERGALTCGRSSEAEQAQGNVCFVCVC